MSDSAQNSREGMSFLFEPVGGRGITASGPSLKHVYEKHPELRERTLDAVWCHCCANCLWTPISVYDIPSNPWDAEYQNGSDDYPVEIHYWDEDAD